MKFEYRNTAFCDEYPSLVVPVSELIKAKNFANSEAAHKERVMFNLALRIYSTYCGCTVSAPTATFSKICKSIGKSGELVISAVPSEDGTRYIVRTISNEGEKEIDCHFMKVSR